MRRPAMFLVATVLAVGVTVTQLGGIAATAEDRLRKTQFLKEANATCKKMYEAIDANFEEHFAGLEEDTEPSPTQIEAGVAGLVETFRGAVADIEALRGPAALEQKVGAFLDRFDTVVDRFEADPQSAFAEELSGYPFAKPDKLARTIGLKECVQRR